VLVDVKDNYKNMKEVLKDHPQLAENARGRTSRRAHSVYGANSRRHRRIEADVPWVALPNIFTGGHNFHSKLEFNSRRGLEKTTETLVHLVQIFAEAR
jgi:tripeptide aminopeptidase